jgi:hypothetical protein
MLMGLLRSPFHGLLSKSLLLISFSGRKSGRRYEIPVAYVRDGASILIASRAGWWKNLRGGRPVELLLQGRRVAAFADVAEDTVQREAELRKVLRGANQVARFMEVTLDQAGDPDPRQLAASLERGWVVVRVTPGAARG